MIEVTVNKASAICTHKEVLTTGMLDACQIEFTFSSEWNGLTKTAVFSNGTTSVDVAIEANTAFVPPEVTTLAGLAVVVGVYGERDGETIIPTVYAPLGTVRVGAVPSGNESQYAPIPIYTQLRLMIGDLANLTTADRENLVEAINSIESGAISDDQVADALEEYLSEHPIEEVDPTVPEWAKGEEPSEFTNQEILSIWNGSGV